MGIHWVESGVLPEGNLKIYRDSVLRVEITNSGQVIVYGNQSITNNLTVVNGNIILDNGSIIITKGNLQVVGGFGCNGANPQMPFQLPDAISPETSAADTMANKIRDALIANGICK